MPHPDAIVIGSGPNGLAAAIVLARAGRSVTVLEAAETVGGGCRSSELTLPGFVHDVCSAVHPFAAASPLFRELPLASHGLDWVQPAVMLAHPVDGGVACLHRSVEVTARGLGADADRYRRGIGALVEAWPKLEATVLGPLRMPRHPVTALRFALQTLTAVERAAPRLFATAAAQALLAGSAAHSMLPLSKAPTAGVGLTLTMMAHVAGWPMPRGGAQRLADALASYLRSLGGEIVTGSPVRSIDDLPPARAVLCDLSPAPLLRVAGHRFPARYRRALERYRYGMGVFKVDWALDAPIPWRHPAMAQAGTVHLGGTMAEIAQAEREAWDGRHAERPFVILAQPTVADATRAPAGKHVAWGYCHVPHGSPADMLSRVEAQIERHAPGFGDRVLARAVMRPADMERHNPNYVGGDIAAGVCDLRQLFARPTWRTYSTPWRGLYICSSSTPPGVGVHGMCGYFAAQRALAEVLRD